MITNPEQSGRADSTFPIRLGFPLGDGNWNKRYATLLLHESGEMSWDVEGFKARENAERAALFEPAERGGPACCALAAPGPCSWHPSGPQNAGYQITVQGPGWRNIADATGFPPRGDSSSPP